jgi:hypothetical protein
MGAGSIRANRAVSPTLVFDESFADFLAAGSDPLHRINLNIASIDAPTMAGEITTMRTAHNVSGAKQNLAVSTQAPTGAKIIVSDHKPGKNGAQAASHLAVGKNKNLKFWVTISAPELANGQYFGRITLTPQGGTPVVLPVAFVKKQGAVTLSHSCDPDTIAAKTGVSHCAATVANFAQTEADVSLEVTNLDSGRGLEFSNIGAPASAIHKKDGVKWSGVLSPAIPPQIDSITPASPAETPDGGYLALSLFGIPATPGVGDDTITNFTVPTFYYGGEAYSSIGVGSNGTLVVGGGSGADATPFPQDFPNAARPNNVIAPLWTDLNPGSAGAIRVALLSGGGFGWIVIDWDSVRNFSNATTHSFEIWLQRATGSAGTGPESEAITISYGPNLSFPGDGPGLGNASMGDPGTGWNWGAENRDGTSGVSLASAPADGSEWFVNTSPPTAGGMQTITYDLSARRTGVYRSVAEMTSDQTSGTTQVVQRLTVN